MSLRDTVERQAVDWLIDVLDGESDISERTIRYEVGRFFNHLVRFGNEPTAQSGKPLAIYLILDRKILREDELRQRPENAARQTTLAQTGRLSMLGGAFSGRPLLFGFHIPDGGRRTIGLHCLAHDERAAVCAYRARRGNTGGGTWSFRKPANSKPNDCRTYDMYGKTR